MARFSLSDAGFVNTSLAQYSPKEGGMSSGNFSSRKQVVSYRQHFAIVWRQFLHENFDSPAHAAHVFQVDGTTADKWWRGLNAPSGWVVGRAIADPSTRHAALSLLTGEA